MKKHIIIIFTMFLFSVNITHAYIIRIEITDTGGYVDCIPNKPVPAEHDRSVRTLLRMIIKTANRRGWQFPLSAYYETRIKEMWVKSGGETLYRTNSNE